MAQLQRVAISPSQLQNQQIFLSPQQQHYLSRVLRLQIGDRFIAINGQGESWLAKLKGEQAEIIEPIHVQTELPVAVNLIVALPKGNGFDEVVRQATALGVACIMPVISDRTLLHPSPQKLERWRRIAAEAAEQSERQIIPTIVDPIPFSKALSLIVEAQSPSSATNLNFDPFPLNFLSQNHQLYICVARGNYPHLLTFLLPTPPLSPSPITIAIGPEGGWTDTEVEKACTAYFQPVSLGSRILTAVLAPIVALSLLAAATETGSIKYEG